ncbi:universal stress protein [bacterium]|nr:universal stress protein [bacterium]
MIQPISVRSIVVPLDGSDYAEGALPWAIDMAKKFQAQLVLLRIGLRPELGSLIDAQAIDGRLDEQKVACTQYLDQVRARLGDSEADISCEYQLGSPSQCIVERSQQVDCGIVVMTSHGREGLSRWLIGSVAEKVSRHAHCPVMLVRQPVDEPSP